MRATVYRGKADVRVEQVRDAAIALPTDALVRITHACVCGSDLWFYRGLTPWQPGWRTGHEWMGVVEDVGPDVTSIKRGDQVFAPFLFSDGTCEFCRAGLPSSCVAGGGWGGADNDGGQGEAVRAPLADGTLVKLPRHAAGDEKLLSAILALTDVMATGHHAARSAGVEPGATVAVIGDGAVGLCGVLAARRLNAKRIILFGRNPKRIEIAAQFGATEVVQERGADAVSRALEMTSGGPAAVLECVGTQESMAMATGMCRPGGTVGYVGVPMGAKDGLNLRRMFEENIALRGGVAPVRAYADELLADVLAGTLDPSPIFDLTVGLDDVPRAYAAMDSREAIKAMIKL